MPCKQTKSSISTFIRKRAKRAPLMYFNAFYLDTSWKLLSVRTFTFARDWKVLGYMSIRSIPSNHRSNDNCLFQQTEASLHLYVWSSSRQQDSNSLKNRRQNRIFAKGVWHTRICRPAANRIVFVLCGDAQGTRVYHNDDDQDDDHDTESEMVTVVNDSISSRSVLFFFCSVFFTLGTHRMQAQITCISSFPYLLPFVL